MKRILVVDDDSGMRLILRRFLEREGFSINEAKNGTEAMNQLRERTFDLVITDMIMPEKTGFELIHELRELRPGSKVIAFSGGGVVGSAACLDIARRDGAIKTFAKPFDMDDFIESVKSVI